MYLYNLVCFSKINEGLLKPSTLKKHIEPRSGLKCLNVKGEAPSKKFKIKPHTIYDHKGLYSIGLFKLMQRLRFLLDPALKFASILWF